MKKKNIIIILFQFKCEFALEQCCIGDKLNQMEWHDINKYQVEKKWDTISVRCQCYIFTSIFYSFLFDNIVLF